MWQPPPETFLEAAVHWALVPIVCHFATGTHRYVSLVFYRAFSFDLSSLEKALCVPASLLPFAPIHRDHRLPISHVLTHLLVTPVLARFAAPKMAFLPLHLLGLRAERGSQPPPAHASESRRLSSHSLLDV
mmetsp:Transcript_7136/g.22043  ORF Transcript_7136/g.22043 Transcript_7136/m.22043 type:complete len:131 (-) Transcript_7136:735-1127(-)|eukprot:scaffold88131_cov30-Tisochrysis_lutea.AAC.2